MLRASRGGRIGGLTSFWILYAIHDALVKPMLWHRAPYTLSDPQQEVGRREG